MRVALLIIFGCIGTFQLRAQHSENIVSGRPGISSPSVTVGKNVWQVQSGVEYYGENYWTGAIETRQTGQVLNTLVRYGLLERLELAVGFNTRADQIEFSGITSGKFGINGLGTHLRANILQEKKFKPSMALQFNLAFPYATGTYASTFMAPKLALHVDKTVFTKWTLTANVGAEYVNNVDFIGFYIVSVTYAINSKVSVFGEHYAYILNGIDYKFDGGFAYILNKNFQLDLSGGYDKNKGGENSFFISTGISWRFDKNWKHKIVESTKRRVVQFN